MSAPYRALIVDDESLARAGLRAMLASEPSITVVGEAATALASAAAIRELAPDIVFLDIRLPDCDGFRVLSGGAVPESERPSIVFVTAHAQHAVDAFDMSAADYLLKPYDRARLSRAVRRAIRDLTARRGATSSPGSPDRAYPQRVYPERVLVRHRDVVSFVSLADVAWIEVLGNYLRLFVDGRPHLVRKTLNAFAAQLDPAVFLRISRSVVVNLQHVVRVRHHPSGQSELHLRGGLTLSSSRRYRRQVRTAF